MSSDPKWDEARKREKAFHQERLKAIVDDEKLLDPKTDLFQKYEDAGDRLKRNEYTDKEDRKYDIDLRRAILGLKPNIRFDETTGKLRSSQAKQFNIVVHDVNGNRFVCYAHSKDTPTIFKYPYVSGETRIGTPRAAPLRPEGTCRQVPRPHGRSSQHLTPIGRTLSGPADITIPRTNAHLTRS